MLGGLSDFTIRGTLSMESASQSFWLSYATAASDNALLIGIESGVAVIRMDSSTWTTNVTAAELTDGAAHEWTLIRSATSGAMSLYIDGRMRSSTTGFLTGAALGSGGTLILGQEQDTVGGGFQTHQIFKGNYANLAVYNTAWDASRVASETGRVVGTTSDRLAQWTFDSMSGGQVADAVGGRTLTLTSITPTLRGSRDPLPSRVPQPPRVRLLKTPPTELKCCGYRASIAIPPTP